MAYIKIREKDETVVPSFTEPYDIVYIPGLPGSMSATEYVAVEGIENKIGTPIYCKTLNDFKKNFGAYPYLFEADEVYPAYIQGDSEQGVDGQDGFILPSGVTMPTYAYRKGEYERSYIMAIELLQQGIPVIYEAVVNPSENQVSSIVKAIYEQLATGIAPSVSVTEGAVYYRGLDAKGEYEVKYITSGAYPTFEYYSSANGENAIANLMLQTAWYRGDAIALIDHLNIPSRTLIPADPSCVYQCVKTWVGGFSEEATEDNSPLPTYGALFTPFVNTKVETMTYNKSDVDDISALDHGLYSICMPASFSFLYCLAKSLQNSNQWLAVAGVTRGQIYNLVNVCTNKPLTNAIADAYQKFAAKDDDNKEVAINAITNIKPYGQTIWGNRTLRLIGAVEGGTGDSYEDNALVATSFLNLRLILCDIKKSLYRAARYCMFDNNSDVLWVNFKSKIMPMLDSMRTSNVIFDYKIMKDTTVTERAKLAAHVTIYPVYAVEKFDITISITDTDVEVE